MADGLVNKALKIRIYPTKNQIKIIESTFGACRFIYNNYLQERNEFYIENILPIKSTTTKQEQSKIYSTFKRTSDKEYGIKYPWMKETSSTARHESIRHCDIAYSKFFKNAKTNKKVGKNKNKYGFPQFKSKKDSKQSYSDRITKFNFFSKFIVIPKCGKVKFSHSKLPSWFENKEGMSASVTISKNASGQYFASLLFSLKNNPKTIEDREESIGLDFSPEKLYVDSNNKTGIDFGYIAQKQRFHKKLKKLQKSFAKKKTINKVFSDEVTRKVHSKNKEKARVKLARCEKKIADCRKDFIEKETLKLVKNYNKIVVEDLNLKGISSFLRNAKNMNDTSWATFVNKLEQKGKDYNCFVVKADRFFPSSQICSHCGFQNKSLKLSERSWICPNCGENLNRDLNAAINLKNYIPLERRKFTSVENSYVESLVNQIFNAEFVEPEIDNCEMSKKIPLFKVG